jgi:hypothetical protein
MLKTLNVSKADKIVILILALVFIVMFISCGDNTDTKTNKTKTDSTKKEDIKTENKQSDKKPTEENKTDKNELGMSTGLPQNFPSDIPKPQNAEVTGNISTSEGTNVTFISTDKISTIVDFYKEQMKKNGFKELSDPDYIMSEKGGMVGWEKNGKKVTIAVTFDKETNKTQLVITYQ